MVQVLEARAGNLAPGVPDFRMLQSTPAAATWRSASWAASSGSTSSCGHRHRCVSALSRGVFAYKYASKGTHLPAQAKPCAPDPVEKGGAGCSTGACEPESVGFILYVFNIIFSCFFLRTTDFTPTACGTQACLR